MMRIGFDAHILAPEHHKYHPEIAMYTKLLLRALLAVDVENTYVVFLDARTPAADVAEFAGRPRVEIRHFPFTQYRAYLPFVYTHMLVSSCLTAARLDVFHSPEGLIPYLYLGNIVATFHWVPLGERGTNVFLKTWMFGARMGFSVLCRKAVRILLRREGDKKLLCEVHRYPERRAVVMHCEDLGSVDWDTHVADVLAVYRDVVQSRKPGLLARLPKPRLPRGVLTEWGLPRLGGRRLARKLPRLRRKRP